MAEETPGRGDASPSTSSDRERERILQEVMREERRRKAALEFQRLERDREQRRKGLGPRHGILALAVVFTAWIWSAPTVWIQPPLPRPSVEYLDASLRLALYLQGQRIESYRAREGRLPENLEEVGAPFPELRYFRTERGTYHLEGITPERVLYYASSLDETPEEFLGPARTRIFEASFWDDGR